VKQILAIVQCSIVLGACSAGFGKKWQTIPRESNLRVQEVSESHTKFVKFEQLTVTDVLHEFFVLHVVARDVKDQRRAFPGRTDRKPKAGAHIPVAGGFHRCVDGELDLGVSPSVRFITSVVARWSEMPPYGMCDQVARHIYRGIPMLTDINTQGPPVDRDWRVRHRD
jgi:hypothetical protein